MARSIGSLFQGIVVAIATAGFPGAASALQPAPIDTLTATVSTSAPDKVDLAWTVGPVPTSIKITSLEVRYSTTGAIDSKGKWGVAASVFAITAPLELKAGESADFAVTTLPLPAGTYWFAACAENEVGWGAISSSNPPPVTIGGPGVVPPVTGLAVLAGSATLDSLTLTWNPLTGGATEIRIFYSTSAEPFPSTPGTDWIPGSPTQVTVPLLAAGTTYTFAARSRIDVNQESELSAAPHASGSTLSPSDPLTGPGDGGSSATSCGLSAGTAGLLPVLLTGFLIRRRIR